MVKNALLPLHASTHATQDPSLKIALTSEQPKMCLPCNTWDKQLLVIKDNIDYIYW